MSSHRNNHHSPHLNNRSDVSLGLLTTINSWRRRFILPAILVFTFGIGGSTLFEIRTVSGDSMLPGYPEGTNLVVFRWAYGLQFPIINRYLYFWKSPSSGDAVVFFHPVHRKPSLKRVALGPGTPLVVVPGGLSTGKGVLPLSGYQREGVLSLQRVPPGQIFVVGTNLAESTDSRDYGSIPIATVSGLVIFSWK